MQISLQVFSHNCFYFNCIYDLHTQVKKNRHRRNYGYFFLNVQF